MRPLTPSEQETVVREVVPWSYFGSYEMVVVWAGAGAGTAGAAGADSTGTARAEEERAKKVTREEMMVVFILIVFLGLN